jgi:hypothetical protein
MECDLAAGRTAALDCLNRLCGPFAELGILLVRLERLEYVLDGALGERGVDRLALRSDEVVALVVGCKAELFNRVVDQFVPVFLGRGGVDVELRKPCLEVTESFGWDIVSCDTRLAEGTL